MSAAEDLLVPDQFDEINRAFYTANPAQYLSTRLRLALLLAAKPEGLDDLIADGLEYRELRFAKGPDRDDDVGHKTHVDLAELAETRASVVAIESEVVLHHTVESLLRLFLAHANEPMCPRLEMAKIRRAGDFKRLVESRILNAETETLASEVARVFMVTDDLDRFSDHERPPEDQWNRSVEVLEGWLRHLAHLWLRRAPAYNTAKHGLGVNAGPSMVRLGDADTAPVVIEREDDGITFLDLRKTEKGHRWFQSMLFVEPDLNFALAHQAIMMITELWSVAKARYAGSDLDRINFFGVSAHDVMQTRLDGKWVQPLGLDIELAYYKAEDENE